MITWADVVALAPELGSLPIATQNAILAAVSVQVAAHVWGIKYNLACIYLAAHMGALSLMGSNGPSGQVIAESAGNMSRQYANNSPMGTDPLWDRTPWGREYRRLLRSLATARIGFVT